MTLRFTVLASGSSGNASWLDAGGFGVLIDVGLGPRLIASRLAAVGASWRNVQAVVLTHTHADHVNAAAMTHLKRLNIPLYCHAAHRRSLRLSPKALTAFHESRLLHEFEADRPFELAPGLACRPVPLSHDSGDAYGFRFEGSPDLFGRPHALAYAADLGTWTPEVAQALADVDLLALEFNHDISLEKSSGRPAFLIARVLGDGGHLSNCQAAALLREIVHLSPPGRLRHLVQLHLSRDCNRPYLAADAARQILASLTPAVEIRTATQFEVTPTLTLGQSSRRPRSTTRPMVVSRRRTQAESQPYLPGMPVEVTTASE